MESEGRTENQADIAAIAAQIRVFAAARDWDQFHNPKNLTLALMGEVGELAEILQWLTAKESSNLDEAQKEALADELADVLIYLIRLADVTGVDLIEAANRKMLDNERRYPVELSRGSAVKYSDRDA